MWHQAAPLYTLLSATDAVSSEPMKGSVCYDLFYMGFRQLSQTEGVLIASAPGLHM